MSSAVIVVVVMGAIAAISSAIVAGRRSRSLAALNAVPASTISGAGDGPVRLSGTVVADGDARVTGAFSGTPGVISVSERWEKSSRGQRLRRLDHTLRALPFILEDETGRVRVIADDTIDAVVDLAPATVATSGPNRVFGAGVMAANMNNTQETLEGVVPVGAKVTVSGVLHRREDGTLELVGQPKLIVAVQSA